MSEVEITTDGSCLGNPGPGGWACILRCGQHERVLQGGVADTTNNRMELIAAIEGLRALKRASQVTVLTDSEYVRRGITEFLPRWKANGWRASTPRGSPQNRPMRITSKPANGTESGQAHLYLVRTASDNGFSTAGMTGHILTNTWAEDRAPQGCDPSADPEAGMAGRRPSRPPGF